MTKGRNTPNLQRFLYLSPTNKQVVWATKATSKGKLSKKGLTLDGITELHSEDDGIRVEAVRILRGPLSFVGRSFIRPQAVSLFSRCFFLMSLQASWPIDRRHEP